MTPLALNQWHLAMKHVSWPQVYAVERHVQEGCLVTRYVSLSLSMYIYIWHIYLLVGVYVTTICIYVHPYMSLFKQLITTSSVTVSQDTVRLIMVQTFTLFTTGYIFWSIANDDSILFATNLKWLLTFNCWGCFSWRNPYNVALQFVAPLGYLAPRPNGPTCCWLWAPMAIGLVWAPRIYLLYTMRLRTN